LDHPEREEAAGAPGHVEGRELGVAATVDIDDPDSGHNVGDEAGRGRQRPEIRGSGPAKDVLLSVEKRASG
jgi:hypothetical protein